MLQQLSDKIAERNLTYVTSHGEFEFELSDKSTETEEYADIFIKVKNNRNGVQSALSEAKLCRIPVPIEGSLLESKGTLYRMINCLIVKDGFYIVNTSKGPTLKFSRKDTPLLRIQMDKDLNTLRIFKFDNKERNERGELNIKRVSLFSFLIALGAVRDINEYNLIMHNEMTEMFMDYNTKIESRGELAAYYLQDLFGRKTNGDPCKELEEVVFKSFFNTGSTWDNKGVFFSFKRFIGCELVECSDNSIMPCVIDNMLAMELDKNPKVVKAILLIDGVEESFYPDRTSGFSADTLIKVIKLFCLLIRHQDSVSYCDENAIYNRKFYMFYDYVADYIESLFQRYALNNGLDDIPGPEGMLRFINDNCKKAKEAVSVPNCVARDALNYNFTKDMFRSSESFKDEDKQVHKTYLGWISPSISSDGNKIGLTGCLDYNAINNNKLCRKFIVSDTQEEVYLEPWQTYNQIIGVLDVEKNKIITTLNGDIITVNGTPPLLLKSSDIFDALTGSIIGKNSNHAKRDVLGYKAINQSMPSIGIGMHKKTKLENTMSGKNVGRTVRDVLDEISARSAGKGKIYTEDSEIRVSRACTFPNGEQEIDGDNKLYITLDVDSRFYNYRTLRYIMSATQNTRLYYTLNPPSDGDYYKLDDVLISCGTYDDVGEEVSIMFANIDGTTYEDAVSVTSDFVDRLGFTIEVYFHEDLEISKLPRGIADVNLDLTREQLLKLDARGLPKKGKFFSVGELLAKVKVIDSGEYSSNKSTYSGKNKTLYSSKAGFVKDVIVKSYGRDKIVEIRVILSEIRKLRPGDKTGNGHGNKGVVMQVIDSSDLICNGKSVDMIINPLGTLGRMNIGQLKEMLSFELCNSSGKVLNFRDIGTEHLTIKQLTEKLEAEGNYKEHDIIYKGNLIKGSFFVSSMKVYRTEHISSSKINYTERPRLNINGVVDRGQRMSELGALSYSCYGADDVLEYLIDYQSRTTENYKIVQQNLIHNVEKPQTPRKDISPYRVNAFMNCIGIKFDEEGTSLLVDSDIRGLKHINRETLSGDILHKESIHGRFDIDDTTGYTIRAKITKNFKIILPAVLKNISNIIPTEIITTEMGSLNYSSIKLSFIENGIGTKIIHGDAYIRLVDSSKIVVIEKLDMIDYNYSYPNTFLEDEWTTGYAALVEAISSLKTSEVIDNYSTVPEKLLHISKSYGEDFFSSIALSGIPLAPVNLRPMYEGMPAQGLDKLYRSLITENSDERVWDILVAITKDINGRLTAHGGSKEDRQLGVESHGEKMTELRDNLFARYLSNSSRTVVGYDFDLDVDVVSLPLSLAIGMVNSILVRRLIDKFNNKTFLEQLGIRDDETTKQTLNNVIHSNLNAIISGVSVNPIIEHQIYNELEALYADMCVVITREPTLRRQNSFAFRVVFNKSDISRNNPSVCSSYNMDFDGDQAGIQLIMDKKAAEKALSTMSPFNGMFDINSDDTKFKPLQDILLGLHMMTKYPVGDVLKLYPVCIDGTLCNKAFPTTVKNIIDDWLSGEIGLDTTIRVFDIYRYDNSYIDDTVGNIFFASSILGNYFMTDWDKTITMLGIAHKGITSKTNAALINSIADMFVEKRPVLDSLKRMNLGSIFVYTYKGVTLSPKVLSSVDTLDEDSKSKAVTEDSNLERKINLLLGDKSNQLFYSHKSSQSDLESEEVLKSQLMTNEFFNDLVTSGARGKLNDFLAMYGVVGDIPIGKDYYRVNGNYNQGLGIMDKFYLAMPVRASNVNVQNHLGTDGEKLREMGVMSSKLKMSKLSRCNGKPEEIRLEYSYLFNGKPLKSYEELDITKDEELSSIMSLIVPQLNGKLNTYSGILIQNILNSKGITELFGEQLERTLEKHYINLIKCKYVLYKGKEYRGSEILEQILEDKPQYLKIYTVYSCTAEDGICKHCYGPINRHLEKQGFKGNIGINTVFEVGEGKFQATLDSAKDSKANGKEKTFNMFDIFVKSKLKLMPPCADAESIRLSRKDFDTFELQMLDSSGRSKGDNFKFNLSSSEFDVDYMSNGTFIPNTLCDFIPVNCNTKLLSLVNQRFLKKLSTICDVRSAEIILSVNNRFMTANVEVNEDLNDEEDEEFVGEGVIGISDLMNTGKYNRVWLPKSEVIAKSDIITTLCLTSAFGHMVNNAVLKREYDKNSIFNGRVSFQSIKPEIPSESILAILSEQYAKKQRDKENEEDVIKSIEVEEVVSEKEVVYEEQYSSVVETTSEF